MLHISVPIALHLHAHGLRRLTDPNWTGLDLFYLLKKPVRGDGLLFQTKQEGLLYHLGLWFFNEYVLEEGEGASGPILALKGEHLMWYFEDMLEMLLFHGTSDTHPLIVEYHQLGESLSSKYESDEEGYYSYLASRKGKHQLKKSISLLRSEFSNLMERLRPIYAEDYAQRVFHDRELCAYICELVVNIGYPGENDETGELWQWVKRKGFPEWAKRAVYARDRGRCAECGENIMLELEAKPNIDHIIPLAQGGNNDLANLQLLCKQCNLRKSKNKWPVRSSIPKYMQRKAP